LSDLHIYAESGAIGDTALNLCRQHIALTAGNYEKAIIHTTPFLIAANGVNIPSNPTVHEIWRRTNFIKEVITDVEHGKEETFRFSKKHNKIIEHPMISREYNDIREWVDLKDLCPDVKGEKIAAFQPISLKMKPKDHLDDYIPVWDRCLRTLINKGYKIFMMGAEDDPIKLCVKDEFLPHIENRCGKWSILEAIAFTIYKANVVVSCDSWAGIWGAAARKKTAIAWGYRMEQNIDFWVTNFLGNNDCYKYGWSSQKEYCDALLADYLSKTI
jgi:hypothetical protein